MGRDARVALLVGRFALLIAASRVADRDHPLLVLAGCTVTTLALWAAALALALEREALVRAAAQFALWGGVGVVFITVAHRMIPFFTAAAMPALDAWRPRALLATMVGLVAMQAPLAAAEALVAPPWPAGVAALRGLIEFAGGALLLWLAVRWGLVQSLRVRLLAMLHMGFVWLGIALTLAAASHALQATSGGSLSLGLAPLHAFTMGWLGSMLIAMATRVVCGHGGRTLVADNWVWAMFWALQAGIVLRVLAALLPPAATPLTPLAAQFWLGAVGAWTLRYGRWLLEPRIDGRPG